MLELYILVRTKKTHSYKDLNGKIVAIPKGSEGYIVDKPGDMYIVELINRGNDWPITYDFYENEIERVDTDK